MVWNYYGRLILQVMQSFPVRYKETSHENLRHCDYSRDCIGKEVVPAGQQVLEAIAATSNYR